MKRFALLSLLLIIISFLSGKSPNAENINSMIQHPEWYINVSDWSFYSVFRVGLIHSITIENTSDIPYKDVIVRVSYYSTAPSKFGTLVAKEIGILPITLPPHTKNTYLEGGAVIGGGSSIFNAGNLEVLGAVPVIN
ncbi:MAG: hypothetical protein ACRENZ_08210 [Thermodesulfobacteriota bacterium]